jgi:hypothetical protein
MNQTKCPRSETDDECIFPEKTCETCIEDENRWIHTWNDKYGTQTSDYPMFITDTGLGLLQRARVRLGFPIKVIEPDVYIWYCRTHQHYVMALLNTNGGLPCPGCDAEWRQRWEVT